MDKAEEELKKYVEEVVEENPWYLNTLKKAILSQTRFNKTGIFHIEIPHHGNSLELDIDIWGEVVKRLKETFNITQCKIYPDLKLDWAIISPTWNQIIVIDIKIGEEGPSIAEEKKSCLIL